jgi:hypothetical protein
MLELSTSPVKIEYSPTLKSTQELIEISPVIKMDFRGEHWKEPVFDNTSDDDSDGTTLEIKTPSPKLQEYEDISFMKSMRPYNAIQTWNIMQDSIFDSRRADSLRISD